MKRRPLEILADKKVKGKTKYLVKFDDGADYWCDWVSLLLKQNYEKTLIGSHSCRQVVSNKLEMLGYTSWIDY